MTYLSDEERKWTEDWEEKNTDQFTLNPRSSEQGFSLPPPWGIIGHTIAGTVGKGLGSSRDTRTNLLYDLGRNQYIKKSQYWVIRNCFNTSVPNEREL